MRRRQTSPGWDGRRSPLFGEGRVGPGTGAGRLRAALLASHHSPRPAGREGDCSVVEASLPTLLGLTSRVHSVLSQAHRVVWHGRVARRGGQRGGGGLDDDLSQGGRRVGPSGIENIKAAPGPAICKALHRTDTS